MYFDVILKLGSWKFLWYFMKEIIELLKNNNFIFYQFMIIIEINNLYSFKFSACKVSHNFCIIW